MTFLQTIVSFSTASFFLLLPLFYIATNIFLLVSKKEYLKRKSLLAASGLVGIMYMHHAFIRADIAHLGQVIAPLLIGLPALPFAFNVNHKKMLCSTGLIIIFVMTILSAGTQSWYYRKASAAPGTFVKSNIAGDNLWLYSWDAQYIETVKHINSQMVPADEGLLFAPWWPTMYPILQRTSPLRELWFFDPQPETRQKEMIEELKKKKVNWIILHNMGLDGRNELRFSNTHKLLWKYFQEYYEVLEIPGLPGSQRLLHRRAEK